IEVFARLGLVWDEAAAQRRWGQACLRAGDRTGAVQHLAAALELYRRHGAGNRWIEPLVGEKLAAQGVDTSEVLASIHIVAVAIQRALRTHAEAHPDEAIPVRIGLHTGEAVKEGDDFFGTHVALAARVAAAARGGEILVSSILKDLTGASGEIVFGSGRDVE